MIVPLFPGYARKHIPLNTFDRMEAVRIIEEEHDEIKTRYCLGCGLRKTVDRHYRRLCDKCLRIDET